MFTAGSKLCCIVTGASRGLGACLSKEIAKQSCTSGNSVTFILTARSLSGLEETKSSIGDVNSSAQVHCVTADLQNIDLLPSSIKDIFGKVDPSTFTHVLLVNNASGLGDVSKKLKEIDDTKEIQKHFDMNVTAQFILAFLNTFNCVPKKYIVNISTLCATVEFIGFSLYCTSKAACDMMFKVVAKEEPSVRVLNYAPGPLVTDMLKIISDNTIEPALKNLQGLKPEDSCSKLLKLLIKDEFSSGSHIDYYDIE